MTRPGVECCYLLWCGNTQTFVKINDSIKVAPSNQQQISAETPATLCGESRSPGGIQQKPKLKTSCMQEMCVSLAPKSFYQMHPLLRNFVNFHNNSLQKVQNKRKIGSNCDNCHRSINNIRICDARTATVPCKMQLCKCHNIWPKIQICSEIVLNRVFNLTGQ